MMGGCGFLDRRGQEGRVLQLIVLPIEADRRAGGPEELDDLQRLFQTVLALLHGVERDAVGPVLEVVPGGADTELQAAVADDIDRRRDLGQYHGVAIGHARHHAAEAQAPGDLGQRGQERPAFQAGAVGLTLRSSRYEVVHRPGRLEGRIVQVLPDAEKLRPFDQDLGSLDAELDGHGLSFPSSEREPGVDEDLAVGGAVGQLAHAGVAFCQRGDAGDDVGGLHLAGGQHVQRGRHEAAAAV